MKLKVCALVLSVVAGLAVQAKADTQIQIASLPDSSPELPIDSQIGIEFWNFQVNDAQTQVRVWVRYELLAGDDDSVVGPQDTQVEFPGLVYDSASNAIVYEANGSRKVCANTQEANGLFGKHLEITNTGLCTVIGRYDNHTDNSGFNPVTYEAYDTFFVVRGN